MTLPSLLSRTSIIDTDNPHVQLIVKPDYRYYMIGNALGHFLSVIITIVTAVMLDILIGTPETHALRTLLTLSALCFFVVIAIPHALVAIRRVHTTAPHKIIGKVVHGYHHYYKDHP